MTEVQQIDPRTLLVDRNIRHHGEINPEFVDSIRDNGVLQPIIVVRTPDGELRVRMGHRRTWAAVAAELGTVPVIVAGDEHQDDAASVDRLVEQFAENEHRANLTNAERVDTLHQLSLLGLSAAQIVKQTKVQRGTVDAALTIVGSELARKATARYEWLDLEQAAAVAEFDDDPEAVKALVVAAEQGSFEQALQRARADREQARRVAEAAAPFIAAGVKVVPGRWFGDPQDRDKVASLDYLDGFEYDDAIEKHAACPGHAVYFEDMDDWFPVDKVPAGWVVQVIDEDDEPEDNTDEDGNPQVYATGLAPQALCLDWELHGHKHKYRTGRSTPTEVVVELPDDASPEDRAAAEAAAQARAAELEAQKDAEKAARRDVIESNKAWRAQVQVRKQWLVQFLTRKTPPKGAAQFVATIYGQGDHALRQAMEKRNHGGLYLLGLDPGKYGQYDSALADHIAGVSEARANVLILGLVLGAVEDSLNEFSWRNVNATTARYLLFLQSNGYALSPVECRAAGIPMLIEDDTADIPQS